MQPSGLRDLVWLDVEAIIACTERALLRGLRDPLQMADVRLTALIALGRVRLGSQVFGSESSVAHRTSQR